MDYSPMIVISKADLVCKAMTSDSLGQHTELEAWASTQSWRSSEKR